MTWPPGEDKLHALIDEARSGGVYLSQTDLRVHFGLGKAAKVELLEIRWPSRTIDSLKDIRSNQLICVKEGERIVRRVSATEMKAAGRK